MKKQYHRNYEEPNFFSEEGKFYLVRCFECDKVLGKENYLPAVATGQCAWCGWKGKNKYDKEVK